MVARGGSNSISAAPEDGGDLPGLLSCGSLSGLHRLRGKDPRTRAHVVQRARGTPARTWWGLGGAGRAYIQTAIAENVEQNDPVAGLLQHDGGVAADVTQSTSEQNVQAR